MNLSLLTSLERIRSHTLSSQGQIACIQDGETLSDVFTMSAGGGWLSRITTERAFEYKTYDDEPYGFLRRENLYDVYERMERFLDWYLLPG
jgi:hypothetical protein